MNSHSSGRVVLGLGALLYLTLGVWFLIWPEALSLVGLSADNPAARTELRATYGGLELGLFAFLTWCACGGRERVRVGLVGLGLSTFGFAIGRVTGLVLDRPPEPIFPLLVGVEVLSTLAAWAVAWKLGPETPEGREAASG
tara:strand:+ start:839 stop:1261 length:423 start_codon:yes stop_codon:yes gene_type:complete